MTEDAQSPKAPRRPFLAVLGQVVKWGLFAAVLALVGRLLWGQFRSVDWSTIRFSPGFVILAVLTALVGKSLSVVAYRSLLAKFGTTPSWPQMMTVAWLPMAGKYVPGKVASVAGAVWLLRRHCPSTTAAVNVVVVVNGLLVLTGFLLAVPLALCEPIRRILPLAWLWFSLLLVIGLICLHPKVFDGLAAWLLKKFKHQELVMRPKFRDYIWPAIVMLVQWALGGVSTWLIGRAVMDISTDWLPLFVAASALGGSVGFLAVFAPGGIGVREGILSPLLAPAIGPAAAVVIVASRIVLVLVEIILVAVGFYLLRANPPAGRTQGAARQAATADNLTPPVGGE